MASQIYVPGPNFIFTGTGGAGAYEFLTYTEDAVDISFNASFSDVRADFGGPSVPVDTQFMGEQAFISFRCLRYDETVIQHCMSRISQNAGLGAQPGIVASNTLGTLMISQGGAYKLFVYSPYSTISFFNTMIKGFVFGASYLHDNFGFQSGVIVKKPQCVFRALPVWTPSTLSAVLFSTTLPSPLPSPT